MVYCLAIAHVYDCFIIYCHAIAHVYDCFIIYCLAIVHIYNCFMIYCLAIVHVYDCFMIYCLAIVHIYDCFMIYCLAIVYLNSRDLLFVRCSNDDILFWITGYIVCCYWIRKVSDSPLKCFSGVLPDKYWLKNKQVWPSTRHGYSYTKAIK